MGLIRRPDIQQMAREALVINLGDIAREGERAAVSARAEVEKILSEAKAERTRLIEGAVEEGRAQGFERGQEEGRRAGAEAGKREAFEAAAAELERVQRAWEGSIEAFEGARAEMLGALRRDALTLAVMLAERVVKRVVEVDERVVTRQLEAALEVIARSTRITVAVHPDDEALVREAIPAIASKFADVTHAELVSDASIDRGGCVVRTETGGVVDATIRSQVERLAASIGAGIERGTTGSASEPKLASRDDEAGEQSRSAA